jgi:glycosyltransferase involved in cell wall biosynthesis
MKSLQRQSAPTLAPVTRPPVLVTVFTPAYNRERLLGRVYESLKVQTFRQFEWLIVDDGSSDGTGDLVRQWVLEGVMPIRYYWKENGGKHTALNLGIKEAGGTYLVVADSDDWLLPEGLQILADEWAHLEQRENFCGVCGLFQYPDGQIVGSEFPADPLDSNAIDLRLKHQVTGDKTAMNRLEVLRRFPFPEEIRVGFIPESVVWNRIAQNFNTRFINRRIAVKEYQEGGLSEGSRLNAWLNPLVYRLRALELLDGKRKLGLKAKLSAALAVGKGSLRARKNPLGAKRLVHQILILLVLPPASVLLLRDWWQLKSRRVNT